MQASYLTFRLRLARHGLQPLLLSLRTSLEYLLLGCAPVLVGILALLALPSMYAATQPWPQALALCAGQACLTSLPVYWLRRHLHPASVRDWSMRLPLTPHQRCYADAAVAALLVGPLSLLCAISCAIWLYQWPDWLRPVAGKAILLTLMAQLLAWLLATLVLAQFGHATAAPRPSKRQRGAAVPLAALPDPWRRLPLAFYWKQFFWLPYWRAGNPTGRQQTLLLLAALASISIWLLWPHLSLGPIEVPAALWGASAALFSMLLTDRGNLAVTHQISRLRPLCQAWPLAADTLFRLAISFNLLPALCVLGWFAWLTLGRPASPCSRTVALVWLVGATAAQIALLSLSRLSARSRVGVVTGATLVLTAIGSELWN